MPIEKQSLFESLCSVEILETGFRAVKKNKGSAGVDGVNIEDFERNLGKELAQLTKELSDWSYKPKPVRRVEIPKPDGGIRNLGIPSIRDRVVQASMKLLLEPILDPKFSDNSYGFRPGRNQEQAVQAALAMVESGKEYVVDIDLARFFDRVNHDRLIARLGGLIDDKRILRLIGMTLRSGVMANGVVSVTQEGAVQGSPISPLLSNLVLDELDKELEKRGASFVRFADDANIFVSSQRSAERVMESISNFIEKRLKLQVNEEKSQAVHCSKVKFLGMTIVNKTLAISKKSMKRAMDRVRMLTRRGTHDPLEIAIKKINQWYVGWSNYYKMTYYPAQLQGIEAHIRRRLRCRFVRQAKRRYILARKLRKLNVKNRAISRDVFANKGPWALSHSGSLEKAFPNSWFVSHGLKIRSQQQLEHWFGLKQWVRVP